MDHEPPRAWIAGLQVNGRKAHTEFNEANIRQPTVLINLCGTFVCDRVRMPGSRLPECHSRDLPCETLLHGAMPSNSCDRAI